ncbi:1,3-propanediol dehydrogenase [Halanaerobium congolense]|uniref:1,3-propanediol dehydrogenase n=1 Tax=Halanaerobium congolense TaxID=54121 RepID=A0A1G6KZK4_9FIRM|nr:iron-containing alcohol dehydrogenase [Halanaerobium congolense]PUU89133.1 MAG: 1,3-propanediol dehydrogenase [Halanaerobium sp.]SDC36510.1 1,3-propanediol dehydrogenase [Halanaerobium congolense]SDI22645.1 1,3-propanediol dehydrogenase [Halanaerobium congolense]SES66042.1 1,3-propanediol dehydrogenase [Halanaerobium congolense]SHM48248.1 1,3-propanediol dehydrogenase [Halanaerobium congolense]
MSEYYDYMLPTVNFMGAGCVEVVGERCKILGAEKVLLVTDNYLNSLESGPVQIVGDYLKKAGLEYVVFDGVTPNPKDKDVYAGLEIYEKENCDMIVTVGGGSPHDCGKAIGVAATHDGDLYQDYAGIEKLENETPPMVCVNTTAGTASEVTRHAVITDTSQTPNVKFVIVSWRNTPDVSINDPELMIDKPAGLTAATGMDALTHALETYVSTGANPLTDAAALEAMKLIAENLRNAVYNGQDIEARENMANASVLSGFAFNNGGLGYVHAMAHQLGGFYDMPHGIANAILLPYVEKFNLGAKLERFAKIAEIFGVNTEGMSTREAAESSLEAIKQLAQDIGIPTSLSESKFDIKEEDFEEMAKYALEDGNAGTNPRKGTVEQVKDIFEDAM